MNVIRKTIDKKRNIKLLEKTVYSIFHETNRRFSHKIESTEEAAMFFEDFKSNIRTLRILNYSYHKLKMYNNHTSTVMRLDMKDENTSSIYSIRFEIGWW